MQIDIEIFIMVLILVFVIGMLVGVQAYRSDIVAGRSKIPTSSDENVFLEVLRRIF